MQSSGAAQSGAIGSAADVGAPVTGDALPEAAPASTAATAPPVAAAKPSSPSSRSAAAAVGGPRTGSDNKQPVVNNPADAARLTADTQSTAVSAAASKLRPAQADTPAADVADQNTAPRPAATTVKTVAVQQSDAVVVQSPPVTATAPVSSPVSRAVADTLAWAGLDPSLTDSPVGPVESPALLAALAGWRRQSQQALTGEQPTNLADVPQTSQTVDPMVTATETVAADTTAPVALAAAAAADTTPPTVNLTAPADGATVSGNVTLSANAADNVGVAGVTFLSGGAPLGAEDTTAPYSITVNATGAANGPYTLTARARDAAGNITTSTPVIVTVPTAPRIPRRPR